MPAAISRARPDSPCRTSLETARRFAAMEIAYVGHPAFSAPGSEHWLESQRPVDRESSRTTPAAVGIAFVPGLVAAPLLPPDEERYLFLMMNYRRFRAERRRRQIDPRRPSPAVVADVQRLLMESVRLRNRIAEANVRLIIAAAKRLSSSVDQMSDLIGEGMPPLLRAVELFDVHRGHRFSTYATWAVRNQMIRVLRRERHYREMLRGDFEGDIVERRHLDDAALPIGLVPRLLRTLSHRERQVIERRFGLNGQPVGQSLADIARQIGLSKERVRQLVVEAIDKLRLAMPDETLSHGGISP
jgi:RNA polymerase primary sigma factor